MCKSIYIFIIVSIVNTILANLVGAQDPFIHYTPAQCVASLERLEQRFWRDKPDTVYVGPFGLAAQKSSVEQVEKCVVRFDINKVSEHDLLSLGHAYLSANQDHKADEAFNRLVALNASKPVSEKAWSMALIAITHVAVSPVRIAKAKEYLALLDAMGKEAAVERMVAHDRVSSAARVADSLSLMEAEIKATIKAGSEIVVDSVRKQRRADIAGLGAMAYYRMRVGDTSFVAATKIQATQWYNDTLQGIYPLPEKTTLITFVKYICGSCHNHVLQRIKAQNPNLSVVLVTRTRGYYSNQLEAPGQEIELYRKYYLEYLKLPVTLGIWQTRFGRKSDGRLDIVTNPNEDAYDPDFDKPMPSYVIDKKGNIRFKTYLSSEYEVPLTNLLKEIR